jgi:RNA polymerase sigma-70 factor, ECF subfamily
MYMQVKTLYIRMENSAPYAAVKDKEAFYTEIVNTHLDEIYSYARYMLSDPDEAEDITQKTFLKLYENLHKLSTETSLKPWLFTVARNHSLDYLKRKKALQFSEVEEQVMNIPEGDISIEEEVESVLFEEKIKELVLQLPPQMREVMLLKYLEDFTLEQIASMLNQPLNTVKSNFYRGKSKLYILLKNDKI